MLNPEVLKCHEDLITLDTYVQQGKTMDNKAIRDGKYLALPHSSAWQRPPPHFFRDVISLLARVFIFLIELRMKFP